MAEDVRRVVAEFAARDKSAAAMMGFQSRLTNLSKTMLRMAGLGGGAYMLKRAFDSVTEAAMRQEQADKDLEAALSHNIDSYKKYAEQIQKLTKYGDDEIETQMAYAKNLGVTEDKLKDATKAAIGLAARYKLDLQASMMLVGRASQGQTQMLTRYGIVVDQTKSKEEQFDQILKIGIDSFYLAEEQAKTTSGAFNQWENAADDLKGAIGDRLLPDLTKLAKIATEIAQTDWGDIGKTLMMGPDVVFRKIEYTPEMNKAAMDKYKEITGDLEAFTTKHIKTMHDAYEYTVRPRNMELFNQLLKDQYDLFVKIKQVNTEAAKDPLAKYQAGIDRAKAQLADFNKYFDKVAPQYAKIYEDMGIYDQRYLTARERMLDVQVKKFEEAGVTEVLAEQWKADQLKKIEEEITKKTEQENEKRKNAIERWADMYSGSSVWDRLSEDTARGLDDLASQWTEFEKTGKMNWDSWLDSLETSVLNTLNRIAIANLTQGITNTLISAFAGAPPINAATPGAGGYHQFHSGGIVGRDSTPMGFASVSLLARAPKLHTGTNEYYAKLQKGEGVFTQEQMKNLAPAGAGGAQTFNFYVSAIDAQGVSQFLRTYQRELAANNRNAKMNNYSRR